MTRLLQARKCQKSAIFWKRLSHIAPEASLYKQYTEWFFHQKIREKYFLCFCLLWKYAEASRLSIDMLHMIIRYIKLHIHPEKDKNSSFLLKNMRDFWQKFPTVKKWQRFFFRSKKKNRGKLVQISNPRVWGGYYRCSFEKSKHHVCTTSTTDCVEPQTGKAETLSQGCREPFSIF